MGRGRSPGAKGCLQLLWSIPLSTIKLKGGLGTAVCQVKGVCVCTHMCVYQRCDGTSEYHDEAQVLGRLSLGSCR